jgi:hypothetical protein
MAEVDGTWDCVADTPLGKQAFLLSVRSNGAGFSGSISGALGSEEIDDGMVDGATLRWGMDISVPMPMRLICTATIDGDSIDGGITAGGFGTFPLKGTRRS